MKHLLLLTALAFNFVFSSAQAPVTLSKGFKNEIFLKKDQKDVYEIKLRQGDYLNVAIIQKSVDLMIDAFDPSGKKFQTFDSPNGNSGPEPIQFVANASGVYRFEVHTFDDKAGLTDSAFKAMLDENQGKYAITVVEILSAKQYAQKLAAEKAAAQKIIKWIGDNSITLKSVSAGNGFDDLQPLKEILKDVKYVGLGEATHGTSEFFQMKHRMLEFLVKEMGFTVFAIEASYAGCPNINDYVLYGKGDAHMALASQGFWTWDTKEVIDMIEWMRSYNQTVADEKKVKFMGFDIQVNGLGGGIKNIETYLQKVDTIRGREFKPFLDSIEMRTTQKKADSLRNEYMNFLSFFVMSKGNFIQKTSSQEYESTLGYARALGQYLDAFIMSNNDPRKQDREWRDYYMASNFMSLVEEQKPGTKFVLWAHNGHVAHNPAGFVNNGIHPLGAYLKEAYGDAYYAFGFSFSEGSFQSMEFDSLGKSKGLQEFTVKTAREQSLDWYYAQTGKPMFIVNFRNNALPDYMKAFVGEPHDSRSFGAVASRESADISFGPLIPSSDFDGMIFINKTHRAQPTESGMRKPQN